MITSLNNLTVFIDLSILQLYINWMNFFINLLLPLLIMFVLNLGIYRVLKNLWAAHRTCCMNHRNGQNLITSFNKRGRRASMGGMIFKPLSHPAVDVPLCMECQVKSSFCKHQIIWLSKNFTKYRSITFWNIILELISLLGTWIDFFWSWMC